MRRARHAPSQPVLPLGGFSSGLQRACGPVISVCRPDQQGLKADVLEMQVPLSRESHLPSPLPSATPPAHHTRWGTSTVLPTRSLLSAIVPLSAVSLRRERQVVTGDRSTNTT